MDFDDGKRLSNASDKIATSVTSYSNEDEGLQKMRLWDIVKLNSEEWVQILLGCVSSLIIGAVMPIFAVLFGEIVGVRY